MEPCPATPILIGMDEVPAAGSEPEAPVALLLENRRAFLRYLERKVGDRAIAEDILQDAFTKVVADPGKAPAEALLAIEVGGTPVKAYAEQKGLSASNAAVRVFRAREALKRRVTESCGTCAEHGCLNCTCRSHQ